MSMSEAHRRWYRALAVAGLLTGCAVVPMAPAQAGEVRPYRAVDVRPYRAVDLGVDGWAADVNDRGDVVGTFPDENGYSHPFLWQGGKLTDLGGLAVGAVKPGTATAINNRGQVVGISEIDTDMSGGHAFLWQRGAMTDLGTLGGWRSGATLINDQAQVVGFSDTGVVEERHDFLWWNRTMTDLGKMNIADINDRGQMVGSTWSDDAFRHVLLDHGRVVELPFRPIAINNDGWIVGSATGTGDEYEHEHAYLWRAGVVTDLGALDAGGPYDTWPIDVNDRGDVVGISVVAKRERVFLWRAGTMVDLTKYGVPMGTWVTELNDRGEISGAIFPAETSGTSRAVLFRPL